MYSLYYLHKESLHYSIEMLTILNRNSKLPIDAPFEPNILNFGVYLVSLVMQISTFAINYQGRPF